MQDKRGGFNRYICHVTCTEMHAKLHSAPTQDVPDDCTVGFRVEKPVV